MHTSRYYCALAVVLAVAGCGGGGYGGSPTSPGSNGGNNGGNNGSTSNAITVSDNRFTPGATTVPASTTVTWTWAGSAEHNVTFDDGARSATQSSGSFQRTFGTPGSYPYHCTIHGNAMSGSVTVQ